MIETSTGCECFFATKYKRRTVSLHGDQETFYEVEIPVVQEFNKHSEFAEKYKDAVVIAAEID